MSDSPQYEAFRAFAQAHIELGILKATEPLKEEIRSLRSALETRSISQGPPGKDGKDGTDGKDGVDGKNGVDGKDGAPGERGANGIATPEELDARIEARFADLQVRTFADVYQGVYDPAKTYTRGVLTTWGGSLWLSQAQEPKTKPGENGDWKLIVKAGRDGRK
jgi:hypothetical protein